VVEHLVDLLKQTDLNIYLSSSTKVLETGFTHAFMFYFDYLCSMPFNTWKKFILLFLLNVF